MDKHTCSAKSCTSRLHARGLCQKHYSREFRGGSRPKFESMEQRFWSKVEKTGDCWNWLGTMHPTGYGEFSVKSKTHRAHRIAFELSGNPLIAGLVLDHKCRNRRCVNPAHLEQVTDEVNILRGESPSAINAVKTHCINGHELAGHNLYLDTSCAKPKRKCRACMAEASRRYAERKRLATQAPA